VGWGNPNRCAAISPAGGRGGSPQNTGWVYRIVSAGEQQQVEIMSCRFYYGRRD
jgi:hypothetical protein